MNLRLWCFGFLVVVVVVVVVVGFGVVIVVVVVVGSGLPCVKSKKVNVKSYTELPKVF